MEIIAEVGQNHNGDMKCAVEMIHCAKENGADAVKFQLYDAKKLFPKDNNPWFSYNCQTELSRDNVNQLAQECRNAGIEFLASVFDTQRIDWLEEIGVKRYKLASRSIYDQDLIERLCQTGKPLIISLGMWKGHKFPKFTTTAKVDFLYCVSKYPASIDEMRIESVDFNVYGGLSDHTVGTFCATYALSHGAQIIEKHLTLDKNTYGPDHLCSMTPDELAKINRFREKLEVLT